MTLKKVLLGVVVGPEEIRRATEQLVPLAEREQRLHAHWAQRREAALARMANLKNGGKDRSAAMIVAREFASDPQDPHQVAMLAQQLRAWWRKAKTSSL